MSLSLHRNVRILYHAIKIPQHKNFRFFQRFCSTFETPKSKSQSEDKRKMRNIGIIAHIDAGKTTTTERMLFYAGVIRFPGEVHKGDTTMDYMDQERERGITITAAAITFPWLGHRINLIDTPGHVDFTVEVEKALRALDGAVTILDSSAGVEAQTLTVWRQADRYNVPRIVYLNKMDKSGSNFHVCLKQIEDKLKCVPLPLHVPIGQGKDFSGIIDLVHLTTKVWESENKGTLGAVFSTSQLDENSELWELAKEERGALIDKVADLDDKLAEIIVERESLETISASELELALRRITLARTGVPVLCGSSYRNIGVQPLLDAVVQYLPSPAERTYEFVQAYAANHDLCALAFKVQNDVQRGPITFFRIYSGRIETGQKIYNVTREKAEKLGRIYLASADELGEVTSMTEGNIAVVSGLKETVTGDTITSGLTAANTARRWLAKKKNVSEAEVAPILAGVQIPDPVFFCSIEPASLMHQKQLEQALEIIQREDPSFKVTYEGDTGQTIVSGMGELHLEVILERIRHDFKVDASLGPLQVAYRETAVSDVTDTFVLDKMLGGTKQFVKLNMSIQSDPNAQGPVTLEMSKSKEFREQLLTIWPIHLKATERGVISALNSGPLLSFPVTGVRLILNSLQVGPRTTELMVAAAGTQCVAQLLRKGGTHLMEPFMKLEVTVEERFLHAVLGDLAQHRSEVLEVTQRAELKVVLAECPLAELRGYSKRIRILCSGTATFTMEFSRYKLMTSLDQKTAVREITGVDFS